MHVNEHTSGQMGVFKYRSEGKYSYLFDVHFTPRSYSMYHQFTTFNNSTFCPQIVVICFVYLSTNRDNSPIQHYMTGFYNRDFTL